MTRTATRRDPLEPLATVVGVLLTLIGIGAVIAIIATIFGSGTIMGFGHSPWICADAGARTSSSADQSSDYHPQPGVSMGISGLQLCATHPSAGQRLWYTLLHLPGTVLFVGAVLMAYLLVRNAARHGIYTPRIATRLRILGWFLLAGPIVQMLIEHLATDRLLATMFTGASEPLFDNAYHLDWAAVLAGVGLLSFSRIMRIGAEMREDLAGTV